MPQCSIHARAVPLILVMVGLEMMSVGLVLPIVPSLLRRLGQTEHLALAYGGLMAVYAGMQFLFAPVLGTLSDRYRRRPILVLCFVSVAIDYGVTAIAPSLAVIAIGRVIAGVTGASAAVAASAMTDVTDPANRAKRFGYMGAVGGVGMITGPALGGLLSAATLRAPFVVAAALNAADAAIVLWIFSETKVSGGTWRRLSFRSALPSFSGFGRHPALAGLLVMFATITLSDQVPLALWIIYGEDRFGWDERSIGSFLAVYCLLIAGSQSLLVAPLVRHIGERGCLLLATLLLTVAYGILSATAQGWTAYALLPFLCVGALSFSALQSMLSKTASAEYQGQLQGAVASLGSLISIPGPLVAALVYSYSPSGFPGLVWLLAAAGYMVVPLTLLLGRRAALA